MTPFGRGAAPFALTWRRVRRRPGRTLLVAAGVAVAVAFLAGVAGGGVISEDLSLRHALDALSPADRVVRVTWSGQVFPGGYGKLDRPARQALGKLTSERIHSSVELADVELAHRLVKLGATDALSQSVRLQEGTLPRRCDPARCEVVQTAGAPIRRIDDAGVHLVVVGRGRLTSLVPFGAGGLATRPAVGGQRPEPVLLAGRVGALAGLGPLLQLNRSYTWSAALSPGRVHIWAVGSFAAAEGRALAALTATDPQFALTAPDDALQTAKSQSEVASRRVLLVGGAAALLLLAFAGITAGALRRDTRAELRRLAVRGASRTQQQAFLLAEAVAAVVPGALLGVAAGAGADALVARWADVPASAPIVHGLVTTAGLALVLIGAAGAVAAVAFALRDAGGERRGVRPVDVAGAGAAVALALLLVGEQESSGTLGNGAAVDLAAIPLLASFAVTVLLGRLLGPALRVALRWARGGPSSLLIALLTLHRSRGRTIGIVGFLAVASGLTAFALSYRATLDASASERAAYAVPLDYTLTVGPALVTPREVASPARYRSLAPGVGAWPVLRQVADVPGSGGTPDTPTVLGVPAAALPLVHGWRGDFSSDDPATLARLLRPSRAVGLAGTTIPRDATRLELPVQVRGAAVQPVLVVLTRAGAADELRPPFATGGSAVLGVAVPPADRGGRVVAVRLELPPAVQRSTAHQEAEGTSSSSFAGTVRLGPLVAEAGGERGRRVTLSAFAGWVGRGGVTVRRSAPVRLAYRIGTAETALLRPRQPFDSRLLPVVASPDVVSGAGRGGVVALDFGTGIVRARIVAEARRFPTTQDSDESFVVADEASLAAAVGAFDLPSAIPDELWLSTPPSVSARVGARLGAQPYSSLAVSSRAAVAAALHDEPLARGIVLLLLVAACAALVLALVGLALVTAGFLRDERDLLFDLESQGIGPRALAACLRWRALALAAAGLIGGAGLGAVMVLATERLLALDATLTLPDPPLQRVAPWLAIGAAAAAFALAAAAMVELSLRLAHRHPAAGRAATGEGWEP